MPALRHQMSKFVGSEKASYGEDIKEYLKRQDDDEKRFERDLSVMVGCVSPRSLSARFNIIYFLKITMAIEFINQKEKNNHLLYNFPSI